MADEQGLIGVCRNYHLAADGPRTVAVGLECPENFIATSDDGGATWGHAISLTQRMRLEDGFDGLQSMATPCIEGGRVHLMLRAGEASSRPITDRPLEGFEEIKVVAQLAWPDMRVVTEWVWPSPEEKLVGEPPAWSSLILCQEESVAMIGDGLTRIWAMAPTDP